MSASVYGWSGVAHSSRVGATSAIRPRYMTATASATWRTIARSCEIRRRPSSNSRASVDEEVRDLRLRGRVERGQRLVEDDHRRAWRERPGDRDALPLPARELVRIAAHRTCREADLLQELRHPRAPLRTRGDAEDGERTTDLVADPTTRVERRERVLEHHLETRQLAWSRAPGQWPHLLPLEPDRPGDRCDHADGGTGERRLAAARLADEADDLRRVRRRGSRRRRHGRGRPRAARTRRRPRPARGRATRSSAQGVDGAGERAPVHRNERRDGGPALLQGVGAARVERAAGRHVPRRGRRPRDGDERSRGRLRMRERVEEAARVRVARARRERPSASPPRRPGRRRTRPRGRRSPRGRRGRA